ncbi:MAG: nitrite/sulfite reductase [Candidatus Omnitrophota bacterium]|jgi:sulfite reductase (NADPH) hemoprotein beta-component
MKIPFEPQFKTPKENLCKEELNKLNAKNAFEGCLHEDLRDGKPDLPWEAEQLAKSHGVYLEFDRAQKGAEKNWIYMMRIAIPGGGPISPDQWLVLDELSNRYTHPPEGRPSLRLTTRQNIQFHWVKKEGIIPIVRALTGSGLTTLNGCGDNARNVMACPLACRSDLFNANDWAQKISGHFRLPSGPYERVFEIPSGPPAASENSFRYGPQLLNRKIKIGLSMVHRSPETGAVIADNCTEFLTNDIGVAPIVKAGRVDAFQIYAGGGQGERNGKPTTAVLAQPFGVVKSGELLTVLDAMVSVHQEWGDRQNRFWARLKYVIKKMGIPWYRDRVAERLGFQIQPPDSGLDYGAQQLHLGWQAQSDNTNLSFGMFIENGRIKDGTENGDIKTLVRELVAKYQTAVVATPGQHLLFLDLPALRREEFEADLTRLGYNNRRGRPFSRLRLHSSACVGLDTCRLSYTESEKFEPRLIDELEVMGWGDLATTLAVTGCERQCDRPATKAIGLIGSGLNRYQLKLMGTEDGRHQGKPVILPSTQKMYLRSIPREKIPVLLRVLFDYYMKSRKAGETLGYFHRRIGIEAIITMLSAHEETGELMKQTFSTDDILE